MTYKKILLYLSLHSHCKTITSHNSQQLWQTQHKKHSFVLHSSLQIWQVDEHTVVSCKLCTCRLSKMIGFGQVLKLLEGEREEENKD